ncbi:RNA polymerase sigma factor SigX [Novipirellula galeiformis]|uniref:RNA polymerase sigma factor SigX n=1 Tax=Novipirellula galeiformis TaxID=2528004 RepID=A0A5C6CRG4_9BACT|nr:sigma-70 family RNA polymerase sigma factor [Novipirellula galeiformis]TWU27062.1 RNA polymerase sigma factor SigX [Novipirellula galeiformis]
MSLSEVDRQFLQRCLERAPRAWQNFVDRFLGLVVHVANHTAESRGITLDQSTRDDLVSEVFLALIANDFGVLRRFRRNCSLATYLTVVSRRVIARRLVTWQTTVQTTHHLEANHRDLETNHRGASGAEDSGPHSRIENREEVQQLLLRLDPQEANVVRMYHLEGKSYHEISQSVGLAENSIGPVLSRARSKMRGDAT